MVILILNKTLAIKIINMKKLLSIPVAALILLFCLSGCIKNDPVLVEGAKVEFDATALNTNAAGFTYPIMGRIPAYGRVANTTDSTLRRYPQTVRIRINLVGAQLSSPGTVGYEVSTTTAPITTFAMPATIAGQTPASPAGILAVSNAVAGIDYVALSGKIDFPANSSFGFINITILNPGSIAGQGKYIGLKLNNSGTIKPSINYSELGLVIDQR